MLTLSPAFDCRHEFPRGFVGERGFVRVFKDFMRRNNVKTPLSPEQVDSLLSRLFAFFDRDHNGFVDSRELLSGLSILCTGDHTDRIKAAFDMYDYDGNGVISLDEMTRYLTSVFGVIAETNPAVFKRHAVTPQELASVTALRCFEEVRILLLCIWWLCPGSSFVFHWPTEPRLLRNANPLPPCATETSREISPRTVWLPRLGGIALAFVLSHCCGVKYLVFVVPFCCCCCCCCCCLMSFPFPFPLSLLLVPHSFRPGVFVSWFS